MPIGKYFSGAGESVMADMKKRYGDKKGTSVFYATAEKQGQKPPEDRSPKKRKSVGSRLAALAKS